MKLVNRFLLYLALWLGVAGVAQAQPGNACFNPAVPPTCTFIAVDNVTNQEVSTFCVGKPVRFQLCPGRSVPSTLLYYGVLPGVNVTFPGCSPPNQLPYIYTPTRAEVGMVTVSELANDITSATGVTYYTRTYRVYDNVAPAFTVAPCPSNNALVTVTDATYDRYEVQAGTATPQRISRNQPTVVALAGAMALTVRGYYTASNTCESLPATQAIAPLAAAQTPLFSSLTLQAALPGGAATLAIGQLPAGYLYTLQRAVAGGFARVAPVAAGSTSLAVPNIAPGCYRLRRTDPCRLDSAFSALICTLSLTGSSTQNRNQLLFTDAGVPGTVYTVTRNGTALTGFIRTTSGLEDAAVVCGSSYTYVVTATYPSGSRSVSNPVIVLTQSALPPQPPLLLASFNLRNVLVLRPLLASGTLPAGSTLRYRRSTASTTVDFGTATSLRPQRDSTALDDLRAAPPCYTVRTTDICGNVSVESSATCPALLTAGPADADGSIAALSWTSFTGPNPTVPATYTLQRLDAAGNVLGAPVAVSGNNYVDLAAPTDRQLLRYRLQIGGAGLPAGVFSFSNVATITRRLFITVPTAFTPNGDGLNDVLEIKGKYLEGYTFVVVDRNGQEVFRGTKRADAWDGTIRGHAPVLGTYAWRFQQTNEDGTPFTATGTVTLLK